MGKKLLKYFFLGLSLLMLELVYGVGSNLIAGSQPVREFVHKLEVYSGVNILEQKPLIKTFTSTKENYALLENIRFKLKLQENAYVYLLNLSSTQSSLVFPNSNDKENHYDKATPYTIPSRHYSIQSNEIGTEHFYLVASLQALELSDLNTMNHHQAKKKIEHLKQSNMVDVYRVDVKVR